MTAFVTLVWFLKRFEASKNLQSSLILPASYIPHPHLTTSYSPILTLPHLYPFSILNTSSYFSNESSYSLILSGVLILPHTFMSPHTSSYFQESSYSLILSGVLILPHTFRSPHTPSYFQESSYSLILSGVLILPHTFRSPHTPSYFQESSYSLILSGVLILPHTFRSPHTRYVLVARESPGQNYSHFLDVIRGQRLTFNWSFSYTDDSEIRYPYGRVVRRETPLEPHVTGRNYAEGKTRLAAWFVSNCNTESKRENLAKSLQKWLTVDVYGNCGPYRCAQTHWRECHALLNSTYKFYLSFENSLCRDYVTEKFFTPLQLDVVPVVYGYANYSRLAPPHSYIDALSFNTTKGLAEYLLYLDKNDTAYNEYFRWKPYYRQLFQHDLRTKAFCDLCERLHYDREPRHHDVNSWFDEDKQCLSQEDPRIKQLISE
ncbi:alpha-(1,3)-fucosyltransferase C-like [Penaeus indicus]|uniref:alpha-(1,3)-fucosyltransferase C-like n=1 Tax=Penaeus indicus TaxID=29960 RepID=UPI00300C3BA7